MTVPGYKEFMYPFLQILKDGKEHRLQDLYSDLAEYFDLTDRDIAETLPSGKQTLLTNRVGWARTYLSKAGLIKVIRRAVFRITDEGLNVANDPSVTRIDKKFLTRYPSFKEFINKADQESIENEKSKNEKHTPLELIDENYNILKNELQDVLLNKTLECSPAFFERLIVQLLVSMGYGGSVKDAGEAIGKSGDEGIDGIIKEDVLGLEMIYLQAKRWKKDSTVGRPEIQTFVGSLVGKQASKGIFITTAKFSNNAYDYAKSIDKRVILIDGQQLTDLMFKYGVGVTNGEIFVTKRLDSDFFEE
ncbi:restriction endonuclease [Sporolactobacillus sp. THM19-2]|jgi:restriction system protein|uniref:restriction endonuclease n=1 Tax=Sporolactobacillus sp. THM19-2 TaxID=2511171 RepID=UPI001020F2CB|nr:restriction endonuclease [Sporolactobacillus sp. THM19-2]RYL92566.1 restriction endonuclease [Sporolactobacillus sp. THM19-2]